MKTGPRSKPTAERFWPRVTVGGPDECWEWQGARDPKGYGRLWYQPIRRVTAASRVAYILAKGEIPPGLCVLHSCDHPPCCNPAHLRAGTIQDNSDDMVERGRQKKPGHPTSQKGETHHNVKITEADVRRIRELYTGRGGLRYADIAPMFGLHKTTVGEIVRREKWRHVS